MKLEKTFIYRHRIFKPGEVSRTFSETLNRLEIDPSNQSFGLNESLPDGTNVRHEATLKELETICELKKTVTFCSLSSPYLFLRLSSCNDESLKLNVEVSDSSSMDIIQSVFEKTLALELLPFQEKAQEENTKNLEVIVRRLDALESLVLAPSRRLRCFLSYRFNDENEILAFRISQFLSLLDIEVLSGASYEPRKVSEKVLSRLSQPLDLIVLLLTSQGESMWTRDEIAAAIHKDIALIPIVEKGAELTPGLLADIEYVEFPKGYIGEAFFKLLEAVCFIREQKQIEADSPPNTEDEAL